MMSNKNTHSEETKEESIAYLNEILPDVQKRTKATIANVWAVPEDRVAHVGMEEMSVKSRMGKYFVEFASNSSIHGVNHLAARHRHPLERFLAAMFILGGLACFVYVSLIFWYRYQDDGFILLWDHQHEFIRLIKPSIYICPQNVLDESKFHDTFRRYEIEDTPQARKFFHFLSKLIYDNMEDTPDYEGAPPELWLRILNDLKREFYYETSLPGKATWIATEEGLCISIGNYALLYAGIDYLLANNWTLSKIPMYPPDIPNYQIKKEEINDPNYLPSYICDATNCNITETLSFNTTAKVTFIDPMNGYNLELKTTIKPPEVMEIPSRIKLITMANGAEKESVRRRKCKVPLDKGLKLWPIYTYLMCATEHRADIIKKECGCYPHYVRRIPGISVCNVTQLRCVGKYHKKKPIAHIEGKLYENCLSNCNNIRYLHTMFKLNKTGPKNFTYLKMEISFPKYKLVKKEQFSFIDFLTSVGGAAGLFLGCSVLSFVEIFYYGTLRLYIYKRKYKKN